MQSEEINDQTQSRHTARTHAHTHTQSYARQYASVTCPTLDPGMGRACSPPLACWKINVVEQCSSVLNNVWEGYSRGIIDRKRKEESTLPIAHFLGRLQWAESKRSCTQAYARTGCARARTHARTHKHTHASIVYEMFAKLSVELLNCLCLHHRAYDSVRERTGSWRRKSTFHTCLGRRSLYYGRPNHEERIRRRPNTVLEDLLTNVGLCANVTDIWRETT